MATDWAADVRRYVTDPDEGAIAGIIKYCGIALQKQDSSLVSFGDPVETGRVRENYLKKKLGLALPDADLDGAIAAVGERMKDVTFRNRVTVYYLLAENFGKLGLFGGATGGAAAARGAAAVGLGIAGLGAAAAGSADAEPEVPAAPTPEPVVAPVAAAAAAVAAPAAAVAAAPMAAMSAAPDVDVDGGGGGGLSWLWWLLLLAGLVALLLFGLSRCQGADGDGAAAPATDVSAPASDTAAPAADAAADPAVATADGAAPADAAAAVTIPGGDRVTSEMRDGKPALRVYFETARTDVPPAFAATVTAMASYMQANPTATLAVTGFNDPRGNAVRNAALSQGRAERVRDALVGAGVAAERIELVAASQATDTTASLDEARRVEVVVR
jgi:outer membrane protein OmpA-like peptidoglycan-associated protein